MRIAQVAPLYEAVPPKLYGGTERVVAHLCDALVELGHEITLFSVASAQTRARLVVVRDQSIRLDAAALKSDVAAHLAMLHEVRRQSKQFDILHFHLDMLHLPVFEQQAWKTVSTLHGRLDTKDLAALYALWPRFGLVSISDAQRQPMPHANWLATITHGVPSSQYDFGEGGGDYLAFLGRISPEKRPDLAIHLARRAGIPLRIAAKIDPTDAAYFDSVVRPLLDDPNVEFIGEIGEERKGAFLGNARALLFPINWPEPFGLVMIEAMACGTPVIAWNAGSVPEVIDDGVTGFIVNTEEEALAAIARASSLSRREVRATFERRFTAMTMARAYVEVYARALETPLGGAGVRAQALR
jgi:glycosyltransferase involved in cell wall biosynthesis